MGALPRPDLPPGAHRDLNDALHELHHRGGWPSLRALAREAGYSHTTVSKAFSSPAAPSWGTLELLVEAMGGDTGHFHDLWLAATTPPSAARRVESGIAGRRAELAAVRGHLETGSGLLLVTGEAGMGKTRLVTTAADQVDTFVAVGHCLPLSTEVPLLPIAEALRALLTADQGQWFRASLADCPAYVADSVGPLLPELLVDGRSSESDPFARNRMFTGIAMVLGALAETRSFGLLVEDLHWADASTLDLLEHLVARGAAVPVVCTWRAEDDTTAASALDWVGRVRRRPTVRELETPCLTLEETGDQLALIGADATDEQVARIHARSQGNPLFTEQLVAHVDDDQALPRQLLDLLDRRLAGLRGDDWALTRLLGLAARPLTAGQLGLATSLGRDRIADVLRDLRTRRLVRRNADDEVQLQHPLLAEAVRGRLIPGEAKAVHRSLAEALGTDPRVSAAEVANHWQGAGARASELPWRVAAARQAGARFDWAQESDNWLRVLDLWSPGVATAGDPPATRASAYLAAMDALKESLQWDRAAAMSDSAEEALGEVDEVTQAELLRRAADYRGDREGVEVGMALIDRALEMYRRSPPSTGFLHALNLKRLLLMAAGRFDEARALAGSAVEVAVTVGDRRMLRHHLASLAWHEGVEGETSRAFARLDQGRALFPDGSDPLGDIRQAVMATDVLLVCGGRLDELESAARTGLEIAQAWEIDNEQVMMLRQNLATARIRAGQVARAADVIPIAADDPPDPDRWPLHLLRGVIDGMEGRLDAAAARLEFVLREVVTDDEVDLETLCAAADIDFWRGAPAATLPRLLHDLDVIVDTAPVRLVYPALVVAARGTAESTKRSGDVQAALITTLRDLCARTRHQQQRAALDPHLFAHLATTEAEVTRLEGRDRLKQWASAATAWDRLVRPHDAAYCRWRGAQVALREGQGTIAVRLLKRAAADAREHLPLSEAVAASATG